MPEYEQEIYSRFTHIMKLNKIQKKIIILGTIIFLIIGGSYYFEISFRPVEWLTYRELSQSEIEECEKLNEQDKPRGRVFLFSVPKKCNPPRPMLLEIHQDQKLLSENYRGKKLTDILLLQFMLVVVVSCLLLLTKDINLNRKLEGK